MNLLVFPSREQAQFYLSNNRLVVGFFIDTFLFSKNIRIQRLLNAAKRMLPGAVTGTLLKAVLPSQDELPHKLSEKFSAVWAVLEREKELLPGGVCSSDEILYIIRKSAWDRSGDKLVILFFNSQTTHPCTIAKIGTSVFRSAIKTEFNNTKEAYEAFRKNDHFLIPEPTAFYDTDDAALSFEKPVPGRPLNNYLKLMLSKKKKLGLILEVLEKSIKLFISMGHQTQKLPVSDISRYIGDPIEKSIRSELGTRYALRLQKLKAYADSLKMDGLASVWMHGDLWGGSILYDGDIIGIIDWEFFSKRGVPLWDLFSLVFHAGDSITSKDTAVSDFMNYFAYPQISEFVDSLLYQLADSLQIDHETIPFLFESYLLFNMHTRDTQREKYWQNCLEAYWTIQEKNTVHRKRLL